MGHVTAILNSLGTERLSHNHEPWNGVGLDSYRLDLALVVCKYIRETEDRTPLLSRGVAATSKEHAKPP